MKVTVFKVVYVSHRPYDSCEPLVGVVLKVKVQ